MSNPLKYTTSTPTGALRHATLGAGVANGEYDSTWRNGITPYTLTSYYLVYEPDSGGEVRVYAPADAAELIQLAQSKGSSETTEAGALTWLSSNGFYPANKVLDNIITDGLALLLDSTTATSYPRSGKDWLDLSGEANDGTINNGPIFDGESRVLDFDGVDDYVNISSLALSTTAYTKIAWFNPDGPTNNIISGGGDGQHAFWMGGTATNLKAGHNSTWDRVNYSPGTMTGKWWCGAVTFNTTTGWKLYINGGVVDTDTNTQTFTGGTAVRIAAYTNAANLFNGQISTAQVYNRVLSDAEILQNYYQGPIVTDDLVFAVDPSNLVSFENGTTTTYSLTGSLDGTLYNGVGFSNTANGSWVFDGVDDKLTLSNNINLGNGNVAWTVSAWVKSTTTVNGLGQGSVASNDGSGPVYSMMGINSGKIVYWTYQGGWVQFLGVATINDGEWHQ